MTLYVIPIVEGQTEQGCLERLLQRIWNEILQPWERLQVVEAFRGKRGDLLQADGQTLSATVQKAFIKLRQSSRKEPNSRGIILILLDAENGCPANLAPTLLKRARAAQSNADIACVLAKRMIENWFVAGCDTLKSIAGLPEELVAPESPEELNGSRWLNTQKRSLKRTSQYSKTIDAKEFAQKMNLVQCRGNSPSFDKLCRELEKRRDSNAVNETSKQEET